MTTRVIDSRTDGALTYPRKNSVICYERLPGLWTSTGSPEVGFPVSNLNNEATDDMWLVLGTNTATVNFGSNKTIGYVCLQSVIGDFVDAVEYSTNGSTWTAISNTPTAVADVMAYLFDSVTARYLRVTVSAPTVNDYVGIAVVFIGAPLVTDRPAVYSGATRIVHARSDELSEEVSESGQWLGSTVQRKGFDFKIEWQNLGAAGGANWYDTYFDPFVKQQLGRPFFLIPRPDAGSDTANDVLYCISTGNIVPQNGSLNWKNVSISCRGFGSD